jgi:hypothetical protein
MVHEVIQRQRVSFAAHIPAGFQHFRVGGDIFKNFDDDVFFGKSKGKFLEQQVLGKIDAFAAEISKQVAPIQPGWIRIQTG